LTAACDHTDRALELDAAGLLRLGTVVLGGNIPMIAGVD
jgi:hypothetical protein